MNLQKVWSSALRTALTVALATALLPGLALAAPGSTKSVARSDKNLAVASAKGYVEDQIIYRFKTGATASQRSAARKSVGARGVRKLGTVNGLEFAALPKGMNIDVAVATLSAMPGVAYAQPNYIVRIASVPPAPVYPTELGGPGVPTTTKQWPLNNLGDTGGVAGADIKAPAAWGYTEGTSTVVVAVVDTGVDATHPDLQSNMWVNTKEIPNNGLDDDNNGYVDDINGWNFVTNENRVTDENGHGTHVAGIIGAEANNGGVVGVSPHVKIMALKAFDASGQGTSASIVNAIAYAENQQVKIVNCSWGTISQDIAITNQIAAAPNTLFVCAAGNDGVNVDTGAIKFYPASSTLSNVIAVGASDSSDARAPYSNVGTSSVDVFAPGSAVKSTFPGLQSWQPDSATTTLVADSCDTISNWETTSTAPAAGAWEVTSTVSRTAPKSLVLYNYGNNATATAVLSQQINLTGQSFGYLEFWMGMATESGYDFIEWGIRDDTAGGAYVPLGKASGASRLAFEHHVEDISRFAGKSDLHFYLKFTSDSGWSYQDPIPSPYYPKFLGVRVDDVRVTGSATSAPVAMKSFTLDSSPSWVTTQSAGSDSWAYNSADGSATAGCYKLGTLGSPSGYVNNDNSWLLVDSAGGAALPISVDSSCTAVTFNTNYDTEQFFDCLQLWASPDPSFNTTNTQQVFGNDVLLGEWSGPSGGWVSQKVSLARFAGDHHVYLAFRFYSDTNTVAGGAAVDDIKVTQFPFAAAEDHSQAWAYMNGTSMAAPHVAGIAALLRARNQSISTTDTIAAIEGGADPKPGLKDYCVTGARVNALGAIAYANRAPVAVSQPYSLGRNKTLTVAAPGVLTGATDPDGDSLEATKVAGPSHGTLTLNPNGSFTYVPSPLNYTGPDAFTFKAWDGAAYSAAATATITVTNDAPVAVSQPYSLGRNKTLTVAAPGVLAGATDPDGDSLEATKVAGPSHGTLTLNPNGSFTYVPSPLNYTGPDAFTFKAWDGAAYSAAATATITVTNALPTPTNRSYTTLRDQRLSVLKATGVLAGITDPDGDSLEATLVAGPTKGSLTLGKDGSFTYTPAANDAGTYPFTFRAWDGAAYSATATATITVNAPPYIVIENDAPGVTFGRFINGFSPVYSGGSYTYAYSKAPYTGSRLEARFKGNRVRWIGPKNPAYGMAKVYIDGVYKQTVDCYSVTAAAKATLWQSALLTDAVHTISIEMASGKNPASSGYVVVIDRFEVEGAAPSGVGLRANETAGVFSGTWIKIANNPTYTGSSYAYSYWPPAKFKYTFTGTKCAWIGPKVVYYGRAAIYLDGVYKGTISQYAPVTATSFRVRVWESPTLAKGVHSLEIRPLGSKDAAATGANIVVDAVDYIQ